MMKKVIFNAIFLLIIVTLQFTNVIQFIAFKEVIPDLLFILVVLNGIFCGPTYGMIFGFFGGLLFDVMGGGVVGFNALIYATLGYLTLIPQKKIDISNLILHIICMIIYTIFKVLIYLMLGYIFLEKADISDYFRTRFFIEMVYTMLLSIPLFYIYKKVLH